VPNGGCQRRQWLHQRVRQTEVGQVDILIGGREKGASDNRNFIFESQDQRSRCVHRTGAVSQALGSACA